MLKDTTNMTEPQDNVPQGWAEMFSFLISILLNVPVNNFSVMSGRSHCYLGITSTFWEVNVSCSRIQHS